MAKFVWNFNKAKLQQSYFKMCALGSVVLLATGIILLYQYQDIPQDKRVSELLESQQNELSQLNNKMSHKAAKNRLHTDILQASECVIVTSGDERVSELENSVKLLRSQRNELSQLNNKMSHKAAKLSCEVEKLTKPPQQDIFVSVTGGWCEINTPEIIESRAAFDLTYAMSAFLQGKKVGSFGDGPGSYKRIMDMDKKVTSYDAWDGGPYYFEGSNGTVKYLDLTIPQYGLPLYDWAISLEVAEHIDAKFESIYLSNIVRHAAEGIIISWAVPGQPGIQHINCRDFPYVLKVIDKLGFYYSPAETQKLRLTTTNIYYKRNVSIFRRKLTVPVDLGML